MSMTMNRSNSKDPDYSVGDKFLVKMNGRLRQVEILDVHEYRDHNVRTYYVQTTRGPLLGGEIREDTLNEMKVDPPKRYMGHLHI